MAPRSVWVVDRASSNTDKIDANVGEGCRMPSGHSDGPSDCVQRRVVWWAIGDEDVDCWLGRQKAFLERRRRSGLRAGYYGW
jgi:hypothetical protein